MNEFDDLIEIMKAVRDALPEAISEAAVSVSLTAKAVAERTIKEKGFGKTYSQEEYPVWFLAGKELNKKGTYFIESVKEEADRMDIDPTANWEQFRGAQGLQTGFVDLSYSNKMWAGMFPGDVKVDGTRYIAPLGHNNREGQAKMNYNYERYGDFIGSTLTGENLDLLYTVASDEIYRLIDEKLTK